MSWYGNDSEDDYEPMTNGFTPDLPDSSGANLGNSNAANFPKDESAMELVNSSSVKQEFNLGNAPIPPPRRGLGRVKPKFNRAVGDLHWNTGETWGVLIGGIAIGMLALTAWNRATR